VETGTNDALVQVLDESAVVIAAGSPAIRLLPESVRLQAKQLQVVVDLNAVPPQGIEGVDVMDQGVERDGIACYGAIGVGAYKMKIHKIAIGRLFERNDLVLDAEEIYALGAEILSSNA
jgi:predicted ribosome-associated RNA-binding protein Tma20